MQTPDQQHGLQRGLKNRHIQLIALGGAIGTGLFYGIAPTIHQTGPAVLLGYAVAGFIAFLIMRQLSEMVVHEPVAGSFSYFADKYWGHFAGYLSGWNYWLLYILVGMAELTGVGKAVQTFWPEIPIWFSVLVVFIVINLINLSAVKLYGEAEFWFAIIKVLTIVAIIIWGGYLLFSGTGGEQASVSNLWKHGGFLPNGINALIFTMPIIMFSFGGLELLGITAAEVDNPEKNIPKATNQVLVRILLFYVGSIIVLLCLFPWTTIEGDDSKSPFVKMFFMMDSHTIGMILNFVIFTAALSAYNSSAYCTGRMLYGLAQQGNAPKQLKVINKRGAPQRAILVSAVITALCVGINYVLKDAFLFLLTIVVAALVLNWILITLTHLQFRKQCDKAGITTKFKALFYPFGDYLTLAFLVGILVLMAMTPGMLRSAVIMIPVWLAILTVGYVIMKSSQKN